MLTEIVGRADVGRTSDEVYEIPLQFVPTESGTRRRRLSRLSVAASVAAVAAVTGAIVAVVTAGRSGRSPAPAGGAGPAFTPPEGLSNSALGAGHYSYRVNQQFELEADGTRKPNGQDDMIDRSWVSPNGDIISVRSGSQTGCTRFPNGGASFEEPTEDFLASMPTDVNGLNTYLRAHVEGSSSHDEAVFVAVSDALRTADGLASPRLRAAMIAVLSRTPGVTLHYNQQDIRGRSALRLDFVNQRIRPNDVHSLYFDPTTYQMLEEREGSNGQPATYNGPSPGYDDPAPAADAPDELPPGPAYVDVMTSEQVVDQLPPSAQGCPDN